MFLRLFHTLKKKKEHSTASIIHYHDILLNQLFQNNDAKILKYCLQNVYCWLGDSVSVGIRSLWVKKCVGVCQHKQPSAFHEASTQRHTNSEPIGSIRSNVSPRKMACKWWNSWSVSPLYEKAFTSELEEARIKTFLDWSLYLEQRSLNRWDTTLYRKQTICHCHMDCRRMCNYELLQGWICNYSFEQCREALDSTELCIGIAHLFG